MHSQMLCYMLRSWSMRFFLNGFNPGAKGINANEEEPTVHAQMTTACGEEALLEPESFTRCIIKEPRHMS